MAVGSRPSSPPASAPRIPRPVAHARGVALNR